MYFPAEAPPAPLTTAEEEIDIIMLLGGRAGTAAARAAATTEEAVAVFPRLSRLLELSHLDFFFGTSVDPTLGAGSACCFGSATNGFVVTPFPLFTVLLILLYRFLMPASKSD